MTTSIKGKKLIEINPKERAIIRHLRFHPGKTISEIIDSLQLKRANSYHLLLGLHQRGVLDWERFPAKKSGERGRVPDRWHVNPNYGFILGVEFWNWWIVAGLIDFSGRILTHKSRPMPIGILPNQQNELSQKMIEVIRNIIEESRVRPRDILGISFVAPGRVDMATKEGIFYSHYKGLYRSALPRQLEDFFGLPVFFQHNQTTYAMAEYSFGGGRGISNQITILWRSEIGAAAIQRDQLFFTDPIRHLRFGHMIIEINGPACRCGQRGCLMNYVSEPAIIREISQRASAEESLLAGRDEITMDMVSEAIRNGDPLCTQVVFEAGKKVGIGILNLLKLLDLELINVIGYTDDLAATLVRGIRHTFEEMAPETVSRINIKYKGYDPLAGLRGAAETFLSQFFG